MPTPQPGPALYEGMNFTKIKSKGKRIPHVGGIFQLKLWLGETRVTGSRKETWRVLLMLFEGPFSFISTVVTVFEF